MHAFLDRIAGTEAEPACSCSATTDGSTLAIDARDCDGRLGDAPACRAAAATAAAGTDVRRLRVRAAGVDRYYDEQCVELLCAAGRFAELVRGEDERLADRALRAPLEAADDAAARPTPIEEVASETGLLAAAAATEAPFAPAIAPSIADARVATAPPPEGRLRTARELPTGATVRIYDVPGRGAGTYHLLPVETDLPEDAQATLADAYDELAERSDEPLPARAVRSVAPDGPVRTLAAVLRKHAEGFGVLEDCFADPAVTDVYASGPAADTPLWVVADGEQLRTNVTLAADGVAAIASKLRRVSGQSFSRAAPTIDATVSVADQRVRTAGLLDPATEGHAFAFRSGGREAFTVPALVANGTLTPAAAGLLSVAVRRNAAGLIAGTRGAGKTTALGALLWELPATTRTVVVEDTPELPVGVLQDHGRDVQPLHTTLADGPGVTPTEALHTALRLGESALVLGEVRGEEAGVLYEAMRVGASGETVLGTIHGDGAADVRERVVGDIGVPASSFAATDLVVTCERAPAGGPPSSRAGDEHRSRVRSDEGRASADGRSRRRIDGADGDRSRGQADGAGDGRSRRRCDDSPDDTARPTVGHTRRVSAIEEVRRDGDGVHFASLFEVGADGLEPTGVVDRGDSHLVESLARPGESYAELREHIRSRGAFVGALAERGTTSPDAVTTAYARRGDGSW